MVVNIAKTITTMFIKQGFNKLNREFFTNAIKINDVKGYKYPGCILNNTCNETSEMKRIISNFAKTVEKFLCRFSTVDVNVKVCVSLYGMELLYDTKCCAASLKRLISLYHYSEQWFLGSQN